MMEKIKAYVALHKECLIVAAILVVGVLAIVAR